MFLTQKIRITPTTEQVQVLWALSEKCRLLYNFALAHTIIIGDLEVKDMARKNAIQLVSDKIKLEGP